MVCDLMVKSIIITSLKIYRGTESFCRPDLEDRSTTVSWTDLARVDDQTLPVNVRR